MIAGDEDDRAVFADAAREGERQAGQQRRRERRQRARARPSASAMAPSVAEASSSSCSSSAISGCDGAHDERQADEDQRDENAPAREGDLDADRRQRRAEPAVRRIERGERDAGDRGRQRERQIDDGVEEASAGKAVARQRPGDDRAEHDVDQRGRERNAEGRLQRRQHARLHRDRPEAAEARAATRARRARRAETARSARDRTA